jgi:hypothetical protein
MIDRWTLAGQNDQRDGKIKSKWKILQAARPINFEFFMYRIIIYLKEVISYDETVDSFV